MSDKLKQRKKPRGVSKEEVFSKQHAVEDVTLPKVAHVEKLTTELTSLISTRAYELWQLDGRCHGKDQYHWFEAEKEILRSDRLTFKQA